MGKFFLVVSFIILQFVGKVYAQKDLKSFYGNIYYKESCFYVPIMDGAKHEGFYDTIITYSTFNINDSIDIVDYAILNTDKVEEQNYLPIKLTKRNDSVFLNFFNLLENKNIVQYFLPINKHDTVVSSFCYKYYIDYNLNRPYINVCENGDDDIASVYVRDTTIFLLGYKIDCYKIEQFYKNQRIWSRSQLKSTVLISKDLLVPIDIKEYHFYTKSNKLKSSIPKEKWIFTKHLKVVYFED